MDEPTDSPSAPSTARSDYTERLVQRESAAWKRALDVQRPYRWNLRRLGLGRTLEVGCGLGRNLAALDDGVGVDHNPDSIAIARRRGFRAWTTEEWSTCPDAVAGTFDSLLLAHVLEHMPENEADQVVRSHLRYLRPAARLVLICPQERGYATDATHVRFLDFAALDRTARSLGFVPTRSFSFPFPRPVGRVFPYNESVLVAERLSSGATG